MGTPALQTYLGAPRIGKFAPVTLGHMRSQGCHDLLAFCNSGRCNHSTIVNVGHLPPQSSRQVMAFMCALWPSRCGRGAELANPFRAAPRVIIRVPVRIHD